MVSKQGEPTVEAVQNRILTKAALNNALLSAAGLLVASAVLYDLATTDDLPQTTGLEGIIELRSDVVENLLDAALPQSASDVLAVSLGEGIGGVIGAGATAVVTFVLRLRSMLVKSSRAGDEPLSGTFMNREFVTEAVAGADYFLTRGAVLPFLISMDLDPFVASLTSVFVASVPYELVKFNERLRQRRKSENELLDELLREERERQRQRRGNFFVSAPQNVAAAKAVDLDTLRPATASAELDIPELLADLIKWLEYDVLKSKYSGELVFIDGEVLSAGAESAVFGFLAALSSQLYLDALYQITDLGPEDKSKEARTRSGVELITVYSTRCFSTAALFSVYEYVRLPAKLIIGSLLSGGVEGCVGSTDFDTCVETFQYANPVDGASFQAEIRGLVVAVASLAERLLGN